MSLNPTMGYMAFSHVLGLNTSHTKIKSEPNTGHSEKIRFIVSTILLRTMVLFGPYEVSRWGLRGESQGRQAIDGAGRGLRALTDASEVFLSLWGAGAI